MTRLHLIHASPMLTESPCLDDGGDARRVGLTRPSKLEVLTPVLAARSRPEGRSVAIVSARPCERTRHPTAPVWWWLQKSSWRWRLIAGARGPRPEHTLRLKIRTVTRLLQRQVPNSKEWEEQGSRATAGLSSLLSTCEQGVLALCPLGSQAHHLENQRSPKAASILQTQTPEFASATRALGVGRPRRLNLLQTLGCRRRKAVLTRKTRVLALTVPFDLRRRGMMLQPVGHTCQGSGVTL